MSSKCLFPSRSIGCTKFWIREKAYSTWQSKALNKYSSQQCFGKQLVGNAFSIFCSQCTARGTLEGVAKEGEGVGGGGGEGGGGQPLNTRRAGAKHESNTALNLSP